MIVWGAETVAHGREDGHETTEAWEPYKFLFDFGFIWEGGFEWDGVGGDRPFNSVMRSARWRALKGGVSWGGEDEKGKRGSGGT